VLLDKLGSIYPIYNQHQLRKVEEREILASLRRGEMKDVPLGLYSCLIFPPPPMDGVEYEESEARLGREEE
jgi:hypothetical protein